MTPPPETSNGAALELVNDAYLAGDDVSDAWRDWPLEYRCDVRSWLDSVAAAVRKVKAQLDENIANELGENNAIRIGDRIYRAQQGGTWKVTEDAANDGSLAKFLGDDWVHIVNLKAQGAVTKTRLEALAKERGVRFYKEAAGRYMVREPSGGPLSVFPIDKAPTKALQKLDHGNTLYPVGKKELGK